jgi:hypothetical protein
VNRLFKEGHYLANDSDKQSGDLVFGIVVDTVLKRIMQVKNLE